MGVYIKGMEMPTEGTVIAVYKIDGKLYATRGLSGRLFPLILVQPHGRMIDEGELERKIGENIDKAKKQGTGRMRVVVCV